MKPLNLKAMLEGMFGIEVKQPDFKIQYCDGCEEIRKYVYQRFEISGKQIEHYICEYCGRTER